MAESLRTRITRWGFNWIPAYRGTGAHLTYLADDRREVRLKIPLSLRTRNYVGTIYGGSMYGAVDPIYMIMLIKILGPEYIVWDKSASIQFKKPGRATLYARFRISEEETRAIREALQSAPSVDRTYTMDLVDKAGVVHATVEKVVYIRRKERSPETRGVEAADSTTK